MWLNVAKCGLWLNVAKCGFLLPFLMYRKKKKKKKIFYIYKEEYLKRERKNIYKGKVYIYIYIYKGNLIESLGHT